MGGTKHIGSDLKTCQKTIYLVLKVSHEKYASFCIRNFCSDGFP